MLIWYKKLNNNRRNVKEVRDIINNVHDWEDFERDAGYTIVQLKKDGFSYDEIKQMKCKYVEKVMSKIQNNEAITFQEIGKGVLEDFKKDPKRAEKAIKDLEQGIKVSKRTNDEIIQGED